MKNGQPSTAWEARALEEARALGLDPGHIGRARWSRISDAQVIPATKKTTGTFFNASTSDRESNTYGRLGCTLVTKGRVDSNSWFLPRFVGVTVLTAHTLTAAFAKDMAKLEACGMLLELQVDEIPVLREVTFREMAEAGGFRINQTVPVAAGTFNAEGVSFNEGDARSAFGRRIHAFEQPSLVLKGDNQITASVGCFADADLSAGTHVVRLSLWGVEIPTGSVAVAA